MPKTGAYILSRKVGFIAVNLDAEGIHIRKRRLFALCS
jgi:hypothetical protein